MEIIYLKTMKKLLFFFIELELWWL